MSEQDRAGSVARGAVRWVAGVADLGLEAAEAAVRRARSVLGRSDLAEMASDLHREVKAHGDVVLDRVAPPAEAHMEAVARRAAVVRDKDAVIRDQDSGARDEDFGVRDKDSGARHKGSGA